MVLRGCMRLLTKTLLQFACAGSFYYCAEVLFRLYRHHGSPLPHVFFLGGFACLLLIALCRIPLRGVARWLILPLLGGFLLTGYEYLFGLYFLTTQNLRIWNYTGCPHEYRGLICLQFSLCWIGVTVVVLAIDLLVERALCHTRFAYRNMFKKEKAKP